MADRDSKNVSSVGIFRPDGKMLFGQRRDNNKYTLIGGHAKVGESKERCIIREMLEECGLKPKNLEYLGQGSGGTNDSLTIHAFKAQVSKNPKPSSKNDPDGEIKVFEWIDPDNIPSRILDNLHSPKNIVLNKLGLNKEEIEWINSLSKSIEEVDRLLQHPDPNEVLLAMKHPDFNQTHLRQMIDGLSGKFQGFASAIFSHPLMNEVLVEHLVTHPDIDPDLKLFFSQNHPRAETFEKALDNFKNQIEYRQLSKTLPPPSFPKLGIHNVDETPIIDTPTQLKAKTRAMAVSEANYFKVPKNKFHSYVNEAQKRWGKGLGETITVHPGTLSYAKAHSLIPTMDNPRSNLEHHHPHAPEAVKLHENFHLLMNKVHKKYGWVGRRVLARNLWNALPTNVRNKTEYYLKIRAPNTPKESRHEEALAHLISYVNNRGARDAFHSVRHHDHIKIREWDDAMRLGHRMLMAIGGVVTPEWTSMVKTESLVNDLLEEALIEGLDSLDFMTFSKQLYEYLDSSKSLNKSETNRGVLIGGSKLLNIYNYSHMLHPETHKDYSFELNDFTPSGHNSVNVILIHGGKRVGIIKGKRKHDRILIRKLELHPAHRGIGLGAALHNALTSHADQVLSIKKVYHAMPFAKAMATLPPTHMLHPMVQEHRQWGPIGLDKELYPIAHLESSFGKNTQHAHHSKGKYHTATGALGLKPITAHEAYLKSDSLKALKPNLSEPEAFMKELGDHEFYNKVASEHWKMLKRHLGTVNRSVFGWRWGIGAAKNATDEQINKDPYVQKYLDLQKNPLLKFDSLYKTLQESKSPLGMRVPKGGSNCAKCMYVEDGRCGNEDFVKSSFGKKEADDDRFIDAETGKEVPGDEYCCNFFNWNGDLSKAEKSGKEDDIGALWPNYDWHPKYIYPDDVDEQDLEYSGDVIQDMVGFTAHVHNAFDAARFLARGNLLSLGEIRDALWECDGNYEEAALLAYGLEATNENLKALKAIINIKDLHKAELSPLEAKIETVLAVLPEGEKTADKVQHAFDENMVDNITLSGKHSKGTLVAKDDDGDIWLLKPGSGKPSPAAGIREESASQSRREAAFWHVADRLGGLGIYIPKTDLLLIAGKEYAAIKALPWSWRNADKVSKRDPNRLRDIFEPLRMRGVLHKFAILDRVLGSVDRHGNNIMIGPKPENKVALIDHGSTMAGSGFAPAFDKKSFIPFYLRYTYKGKFSSLTPQVRLRYMPKVNMETDRILRKWLDGLDEKLLESILLRYGIDPHPAMLRLIELKHSNGSISEVINKIWAGLE